MSTNAAETRPGVFSVTIRIVLGLLFVASAVLKGLDFSAFAEQVSYYGIVQEDMHLQVVAAATIAVEILLGGALLIGWHTRFMLAVSAVILVAFTGLIVYAWA
ncbi:MAG TPA: DoxX family membrane protein, partial [Candidatus Hydrogenedentes bacterium]|nr:DoxX family membrane protein [Candidatus Hydrogenedentota bacterium]